MHGGTLRSQFGETSEAMFLTQGFVYASAEQAEARFKDEDPGFIYSRFANPTVAMFEERMRLLEGAEAARATATGMAAVTAALLCFLKAGDHIVAARALFGSCRYVVETLCRASASPARWSTAAILDAWQKAVQPNTKAFFFETPANPTLELVDIAAVSQDRPSGRRAGRRRQRVRHAAAAEAARARRRHRRLFGDQAHRRPGPLPRRRGAVLARLLEGSPAQLPAPDRPGAEPVQCLGAAQGPGDAAAARARADRDGGEDRRPPRRAAKVCRGALSRPRRPSAGGRSPGGR